MRPLAEPIPPECFRARRERVIEALGMGTMVLPAAPIRFLSRDTELRYRPDSELFYLTGVREPGAVAVLRGGDADEPFVLFVRPREEKAELWHGPRLGPDAAREVAGADAAHDVTELEDRLPELLAGSDRVHFRLGSDDRCEALVREALDSARSRGTRSGKGPRGVQDPGGILDELRLRKDEHELRLMREAAAVTCEAHRHAMATARPGSGEWEIEASLEGRFRSLGADGPAFGTIVGSGRNGCVLHYVDNASVTVEGDLVLVDAGAAVGLYAADVTRTFPVGGRFSEEQRLVYEVVERARQAAVSRVRPGATIADVQAASVLVLVEGLVALGVLEGWPDDILEAGAHKSCFPHRISHWLGLDVHDPGDYVDAAGEPRTLEPGMVLTIEPGLYFGPAAPDRAEPFRGIGVRIEDDVVVTGDGDEVLTSGVPTAPDDVEALVGSGLGA